ncbi:kinase-like domain-containing protein [Mycena galericulata]|nr:kinase-like domain-containing protein [Mycena galericulata]
MADTGTSEIPAPPRNERMWLELYPFLLSSGFKLRPRYDPNYVPPWTITDEPGDYEECIPLTGYYNVVDATCIEDGKKVVLKRVASDSEEQAILQYLSQIPDPRNRTIPLLRIIPLPPDSSQSLLVMPFTRRFNHPPFHCRAEFLEAMRSFLEGLQFMHDNHVCHFDIAPQNLMMDETRVVPAGSHFCRPESHTGLPGVFSWENRCSVGPVDYYYIDFGLSMYFPDGKDTALTTGTLRTFKTIPELSLTVPYNPFKVDIFQLGLTMQKLIKTYPALSAFRPVAQRMMSPNPRDRPDPADSLAQLNSIAARISSHKLSAPILEKKGVARYLARNVVSIFQKDYPPSRRYEDLGYGW